MNEPSSVRAFYENKVVFVTGATGFVGKSLVQRLLQTVSVEQVYVLIRPKRGECVQVRLANYLASTVFVNVPRNVLKKVVAVQGDVTLPFLGLSPDDQQLIAATVNIVFNGSASVKFTEPLDDAVRTNLYSTQQVIALCRTMVSFNVLVHISSISAWFIKDHLEEKVYEHEIDPTWLIAEMSKMSEQDVKGYESVHIGLQPNQYPNSYMFTKTLSEVLLQTTASDLKVACARLPMLICASQQPYPGWMEGLQTINALSCAYSSGVIPIFGLNPQSRFDMIPVDVSSNALLVSAWDTAKGSDRLKVYNITTDDEHVVTYGECMRTAYNMGHSHPSIKQILPPPMPQTTQPSKFKFYLWHYIYIMFACLVDLGSRLTAKRTQLARTMLRVMAGHEAVAINLLKTSYSVEVSNLPKLYAIGGQLCDHDRTLFYDLSGICWTTVCTNLYMYYRRSILKEPDSNVSDAVARMARLQGYLRITKVLGSVVAVVFFVQLHRVQSLAISGLVELNV